MPARFLPLAEVCEILNISANQGRVLIKTGKLRAIKVGGRGEWRVENSELEDYIARQYAETASFVAAHADERHDLDDYGDLDE